MVGRRWLLPGPRGFPQEMLHDAVDLLPAPNASRNIHQQSPILCFPPFIPCLPEEKASRAQSAGGQGMLSQGLQWDETMVTGGRGKVEGDSSWSLCRH